MRKIFIASASGRQESEVYTIAEIEKDFKSKVDPACTICNGRGYASSIRGMFILCRCTQGGHAECKVPETEIKPEPNGMLNGRTRTHGEMIEESNEKLPV